MKLINLPLDAITNFSKTQRLSLLEHSFFKSELTQEDLDSHQLLRDIYDKIRATIQLIFLSQYIDRDNIPKLQNIIIQHREIVDIPKLSNLPNLKMLTLANNHIVEIPDLSDLNLVYLDLSHNEIKVVDTNKLPLSLIYLFLEHNKSTEIIDSS